MVFLIEFNGYGFRLWNSPSAGQMKPTIAEGREMSLDFVTLRKDVLSREMKGSSGWGGNAESEFRITGHYGEPLA
jgi:hypothetical protein